jgi:hypothetical protein
MGSFTHDIMDQMIDTANRTFSGLLARAKWFRVILDEAQFIRNRFVQHINLSFLFGSLSSDSIQFNPSQEHALEQKRSVLARYVQVDANGHTCH